MSKIIVDASILLEHLREQVEPQRLRQLVNHFDKHTNDAILHQTVVEQLLDSIKTCTEDGSIQEANKHFYLSTHAEDVARLIDMEDNLCTMCHRNPLGGSTPAPPSTSVGSISTSTLSDIGAPSSSGLLPNDSEVKMKHPCNPILTSLVTDKILVRMVHPGLQQSISSSTSLLGTKTLVTIVHPGMLDGISSVLESEYE